MLLTCKHADATISKRVTSSSSPSASAYCACASPSNPMSPSLGIRCEHISVTAKKKRHNNGDRLKQQRRSTTLQPERLLEAVCRGGFLNEMEVDIIGGAGRQGPRSLHVAFFHRSNVLPMYKKNYRRHTKRTEDYEMHMRQRLACCEMRPAPIGEQALVH